MLPQIGVVSLQQQRCGRCPLDVPSDLDELPTLAVVHRRVGDALKLMHRLHHRLKELARSRYPGRLDFHLHLRPRHLQIKAVQPMPLLRRDLFPYMPRVLPRSNDAREDRSLIRCVEGQRLRQRIRLTRPLDVLRPAQRLQHPLPATLRTRRALIQHQIEVYIEQSRRMLRALEIPAHPVQTVGNA